MFRAVSSNNESSSMFRLPRAAKGLLCAPMFLSALSPAQAFEVHVAPTFIFRGYVDLVDSQEQALADLEAYYDFLGEKYNRTYTISNLHPEPTKSFYYTMNGVWAALYYDLTVCSNSPCVTHPNCGAIRAYAQCPVGGSPGYHVDSPTAQTVYCPINLPDVQPPKKCDSCIGNPIYPSTGQKVQVETDYVGLPGLTFDRTYRSNFRFFASITTSTFTDYSLPYGNTTWSTGIFSRLFWPR